MEELETDEYSTVEFHAYSTRLKLQRWTHSAVSTPREPGVMLTFIFFCRLKEELIRELVKTGREAETVNKKYTERIQQLESVGTSSCDSCPSCLDTLEYPLLYIPLLMMFHLNTSDEVAVATIAYVVFSLVSL